MEDYPTANSDSKSEIRAAISTAWTLSSHNGHMRPVVLIYELFTIGHSNRPKNIWKSNNISWRIKIISQS